ncbi:MAG: lycopene cyclase domain-containing protein [bacterium]
MDIPLNLVYLVSLIPVCLIWVVLFIAGKYTRREMLIMSVIIGLISLVSSYYWWTIDWWQPQTITNTKIGIEYFILGFTAGGIMTSIYEIIFFKKYIKVKRKIKMPNFLTILLVLASITAWLILEKVTSFYASTISMILVSVIIFYFRKDLLINGLWSGLLMLIISLFFYYTIIFLSPEWINQTYLFKTLSGVKITGIPIEELIFWFLAGLVWGPLYEYWHSEQIKN